MENIGDTQIQPNTLDAINRLMTLWNQDPISQTHDLIIAKDQFYTINRNDIPYQLPIEDTLLSEDIEILTPVTENLTQVNYPEDPEKDDVSQIRDDLRDQSSETPFRCIPLTTQGWKNQANEIATRLAQRGYGREKQVRTLETCYYLEKLRQKHVNDTLTQDAIRKNICTILGPRQTANFWKTAKRIHQVLAFCANSQLYHTQFITSSNLSRLTTEKYNRLLEELRTHGVRS